jgi:hypothetical protein
MIAIFKNSKNDEDFSLKGEGVTTNEVTFMLESSIRLLMKAGAESDNIRQAVNEILKINKEDL